jgi:hypothetical protein
MAQVNEIDLLMDLDPEQLSAQDLDSIIAYHRKRRADIEAGIKPSKEKKASLDGVMEALQASQPAVKVDRRF